MSKPHNGSVEQTKMYQELENAYVKLSRCSDEYNKSMQKLVSELTSELRESTIAYEKRIAELQEKNTILEAEITGLK